MAVIPRTDNLPSVGTSTDPAYRYQATLAGGVFCRFGLDLTSTRLGFAAPSGERWGYVFPGFVPTAKTVVGSAVSLRMGGTTLTFKHINGQVKERIRWATLADATARLRIGLTTTGCHFEQTAEGGLAIWSTDGVLLATVPAPTIADATGRSDCAISYALTPDGTGLDLVIDAAWLATATFPVFIDPTTIVSSSTAIANGHPRNGKIFRLSDGRLLSFYISNTIFRASSSDAGATWTTGVQVSGLGIFAVCQNGDTIYGIATTSGTASYTPFKTVYTSGSTSFADTLGTAVNFGGGGLAAYNSLDARWDSVKGNYHAIVSDDFTSAFRLVAISTALAVLATVTGLETHGQPAAIVVDGAATPNVYFVTCSQVGSTLRVLPYTWNGTAYTAGTAETVSASDATSIDVSASLDASSNLDLFWINTSGALKTIKRTGVNTYSSVTTLVSSSVESTQASGTAPGPGIAVSRTGNGNADIFVIYRYNGAQANGEIYYIKRTAGVWGSATLLAGGANTGWQRATAIDLIGGDAKVNVVYVTATTSPQPLVYDGSLTTGVTPSAPINVLPTGNANTSLTPTCSATYKNTQTSDNLGKYRVYVTRVSDSAVFWDTGAAGTTYSGAAITDGQTFSITYAGTALVKGTTYQVQLQFWDALANLAGPLSTAVTFQVNDAPAVAITSSASPSSSGPTVTWSYSQAAGHVQASYRVTVIRAGVTVYDSGTVASAATSLALPSGTLTNNTAHTITVVALSTDGL